MSDLPHGGGPGDHLVVDEIIERVPEAGATRNSEFTSFMLAHQAELLRTAWFLVGDASRAEELTQHALTRTYAAWSRARRDPLAYTRRVIVNLRTDTWRRRRRETLVPGTGVPDQIAAQDTGVENRDEISRLLDALSPRQRRVVVLRYLLDLPESDVANELNVSVGTVKSTASRALAVLRTVRVDDQSTVLPRSGDRDEHTH